MADFEDSHDARPGTTSCRARSTCATRWPGASSSRAPRASVYKLNPTIATLIVRPRGWHLYEKHVLVDGKQVPGAFVDFGLYLFHNHAELKRQRHGPVLLPAEDREPPRGAAVERRVPPRRGAARPRAADHQGDGADRDDPRGVRDGRDPVRAARPHRRPQLRPLGLHLQLHQEVQPQPGHGAAGSRAGDDDHALPALVLEAADQDLPPPRRVRDGRHGGADPDQERPGGERRGARQGARRQGARGGRRARRHLGGASGPGAGGDGGLRPADADPEPAAPQARGRAGHGRRPAARSPRARSPRRACATTSTSRSSTWTPGSAATAACRSTT